MAVPIHTSPGFIAASPVKLFDGVYLTGPTFRSYDIARDDQKFLMIKNPQADDASASAGIVVVLNWTEELKAKAPAK
jgi:hypothetical protein